MESGIKNIMGNSINNTDLFKKVKELDLPKGKYALFGSAPLGIRNLRECHDIDIIVTEDLWKIMSDKNWENSVAASGCSYLKSGEIELFRDWAPGEWHIDDLINQAEIIDGLPFVRLEEVLKWKKIINREKDRRDIEIIESFCDNSQ